MNNKIKWVVFDAHNVLFKPDYRALAALFWHLPKKLLLCRTIFQPSFIKTAFFLARSEGLGQSYLEKLMEKFPALAIHYETILNIINTQKPIICTLQLVKEIKTTGMRVYIFSNMGSATLQQLHKKYHSFFSMFDGIHFVGPESEWQQKPSSAAFSIFLKKFELTPNQTLFIDNSRRNVTAARKHNMHAILYKNCSQLKNALHRLGVLRADSTAFSKQ